MLPPLRGARVPNQQCRQTLPRILIALGGPVQGPASVRLTPNTMPRIDVDFESVRQAFNHSGAGQVQLTADMSSGQQAQGNLTTPSANIAQPAAVALQRPAQVTRGATSRRNKRAPRPAALPVGSLGAPSNPDAAACLYNPSGRPCPGRMVWFEGMWKWQCRRKTGVRILARFPSRLRRRCTDPDFADHGQGLRRLGDQNRPR